MLIGDRVENLQNSMNYREYLLWSAYRNKYGPLNPIRKYDQAGAVVASQINNAYGGKAKVSDFLFYLKKEEDENASVEEFIKALGKGVKIGR